MKNLLMITFFILGLLFFATNSQAFNTGPITNTNVSGTSTEGHVKQGVNETAKAISTSAINDWLTKQNCQCQNEKITCAKGDFTYVADYIKNWRNGLESTVSNDFNFYANTSSSTCSEFVRNEVRQRIGYWDYYVSTKTDMGTTTKMWVKQH